MKIGVFDSGVGGLSVWKEIYALMPDECYLYFSDGAFCPYGPKSVEEVRGRSLAITDFLISRGAGMVVVACNTATAASIAILRSRYDIPFIGMEPAVKPAVMRSKSGVVGVLATEGTLRGQIYHHTLEEYAGNVKVIEQVGDGLVELVEAGMAESPEAYALVARYVKPMVDAGADSIVLGCTHYPFLINAIRAAAGPAAAIINPAPAVARQARHLIAEKECCASRPDVRGGCTFCSSSGVEVMRGLVRSIAPDIEPDYERINSKFETIQ